MYFMKDRSKINLFKGNISKSAAEEKKRAKFDD